MLIRRTQQKYAIEHLLGGVPGSLVGVQDTDGRLDGLRVGRRVGLSIEGSKVGERVGVRVGLSVGDSVGESVGLSNFLSSFFPQGLYVFRLSEKKVVSTMLRSKYNTKA